MYIMSQEYFCVFTAKIIDDKQFNNLKELMETLDNNSISVKQQMKLNNQKEKNLSKFGIPSTIKTGVQHSDIDEIKKIQEEFNKSIKDKCSNKFFIIKMDEYDKILDTFYEISNNSTNNLEFPVLNGFRLLSITQAASIKTTEEYIKKNGDNIYSEFIKASNI